MAMQTLHYPIVLFGEAAKGSFHTAYYLESLPQLANYLGEAPPQSRGLHLATQTLLSHCPLVYFRVAEEGYSFNDYMFGLSFLKKNRTISSLKAISAPGVSDPKMIDEILQVCAFYHCIILMTDDDLYDYLTSGH